MLLLLIGFWFEKGENGIANAKAAKKAFIRQPYWRFWIVDCPLLIFNPLWHITVRCSVQAWHPPGCGYTWITARDHLVHAVRGHW
jgi:hypothetical protein